MRKVLLVVLLTCLVGCGSKKPVSENPEGSGPNAGANEGPIHNGKSLDQWIGTLGDPNKAPKGVEALAKIGRPALPPWRAPSNDPVA